DKRQVMVGNHLIGHDGEKAHIPPSSGKTSGLISCLGMPVARSTVTTYCGGMPLLPCRLSQFQTADWRTPHILANADCPPTFSTISATHFMGAKNTTFVIALQTHLISLLSTPFVVMCNSSRSTGQKPWPTFQSTCKKTVEI
ncbi:MAG: hypothetical protein QF577_09935, partial [Phycisphaerae bacterium]|nr:hypothetical protein [Phycisphaerae bacterium]